MYFSTECVIRLVLLIGLTGVHLRCTESQEIAIGEILNSLTRQEAAIDDLNFEYVCRHYPGHVEKDPPVSVTVGRWIKTKDNRERIERSRDEDSATRWEEVAVFNGRHHMTRDNQLHGSGTIGTAGGGFFSISESPKAFGLLIQTPFGDLGLDSYLSRYRDKINIQDFGAGVVEITGPSSMGDPNERLKILVDRRFGYRPIKIEFSDSEGIYTRYVIPNYRSFTIDDKVVWLPEKGYWYGFDPESRTPSSLMSFSATSIKMNTLPEHEVFVLTYPQGSLILNTDMGESFYATRNTTIEDAPMFSNVKLSLSDHDKQLVSETLIEPSKLRLLLIVLFAMLTGLTAWTVTRFRKNRKIGI